LPGAAIEISDVKCTDLIYIRTLPVVHVQLFRTVYSIFVNSSRELKKVISPDTKHTFTTYSLVFSKKSNLSSKLVPVQELVSPVNVRMPID
jgi:hypothetical protein